MELTGEVSESPVVVEPGLVVGELVFGEEPGDGLVVHFAGPGDVGAV